MRAKLRLRTRLRTAQTALQAFYYLVRYDPQLLPYTRTFVRSFTAKQYPVELETPIITLKAIHFLDQHLQPGMLTFEWGAGGSTAFMVSRVRHHHFVENATDYLHHIVQTLEQRGYHNFTPHHVLPSTVAPEPRLPWVTYTSTKEAFEGQYFLEYAQVIDQFDDRTFDAILVDGRARASCLYHAIPKVKEGGFILLDDSNREIYAEAVQYMDARYPAEHLRGVRPFHTMLRENPNGTQTSIWWIK